MQPPPPPSAGVLGEVPRVAARGRSGASACVRTRSAASVQTNGRPVCGLLVFVASMDALCAAGQRENTQKESA